MGMGWGGLQSFVILGSDILYRYLCLYGLVSVRDEG